MKKSTILTLLILFLLGCSKKQEQRDLITLNFEFAAKQLDFAMREIQTAIAHESDQSIHQRAENGWSELINPRSLELDGSLLVVPSKDWCSGFFPGELWFLFEQTKDEKWRKLAHKQTILLEREKQNKSTHDMGFKLFCSYGNGYRLTKDSIYREVLIEASKTLITRYDSVVGCIRSWDQFKEVWQYPVIIDNMLNLELLFWATKETGDSIYYQIAKSHAQKTMKNHFRSDFSSYHVVDYDPKTGEVLKQNTHQGANHDSSWARGQAWAIYGFTMCYAETGDVAFLNQARGVANYIFNHPNLPADLIPYWDYNAPNIPTEPRDVSAATCTASALYRLAILDPLHADTYVKWADKMIQNVTDFYRAPYQSNHGFLLLHSTGSKAHNSEIDVPLVYADYYFLEALLRKTELNRIVK